MKYKKLYLSAVSLLALGILSACGPSEEELERRKQARQDSLEQVQQQRMQQQQMEQMDRAAAARADSIAQAAQNEPEFSFDPEGSYAVQVGAWRSEVKAQQFAQKWQDRGFENAFVVKYGNEETGNIWFRVRVGTLSERGEAQQLQQSLQENYPTNAWVSYL